MNIQELKKVGVEELSKNNIDDAVIKANILLQFVLKMDRTEVIINCENMVNENRIEEYLSYVKEIVNGKPIQYITNNQSFMGLNFYVDENVLIPQPDTELLVEETIKKIRCILGLEENLYKCYNQSEKIEKNNIYAHEKRVKRTDEKIKILDLCTGSGAIAVAIENYLEKNSIKNIEIYASDISTEALRIARKNAIINNENTHIRFIKSDMFENINQKFDIIVSNPPYIERGVIPNLSKEVQNEPHIALDGGVDGLDFYRLIAKEGKNYLQENGFILLEIGYNQKESVSKIFEEYSNIRCLKDLSGNDRVIEVQFCDEGLA